MCGIVGVYHRDRKATVEAHRVRNMADRLSHRGPDDGGAVGLGACALGHRRLSIVDLSPLGHQPMATADRRFWITFNGEIYNYQSLRSDLQSQGFRFRTQTDTEVLLHLYQMEGQRCLARLNGMFAFAIYDRYEHSLFLARDRVGKKPIYVYDDGFQIFFASELKAFYAEPSFAPTIDSRAIADFLATQYIPEPRTIYKEVSRIEPAHHLFIQSGRLTLQRYWQLNSPIESPNPAPTLGQATDTLQALLTDAVKLRMVSDVPLGAFLSGGVDSSVVVGEMAHLSSQPVKTTSIAFREAEADESAYASVAARQFGCEHYQDLVEADAAGLLETLIWHFDEPFADPSALPTYLLCQATRSRVTVALSGDGGDEAFAGYAKYQDEMVERRIRSALPAEAWKKLLLLGKHIPFQDIKGIRRTIGFLQGMVQDEAAAYFRTQSVMAPELLESLLSTRFRRELDSYDPQLPTAAAFLLAAKQHDPVATRQLVDIHTYLPGDILTKVDRMSMAHALEVRCPLLDHRILEFALSLPPSLRLHRGRGKIVLKNLLERRMPRSFIDRPKHGFDLPVDRWFRGKLDALFREFVLQGPLRQHKWLDQEAAERLLMRHQNHQGNFGESLWSLLSLGIWSQSIYQNREARIRPGVAPTLLDPFDPRRETSAGERR